MKRKRLKVIYSDLAGSQLREILAYFRREFGIIIIVTAFSAGKNIDYSDIID